MSNSHGRRRGIRLDLHALKGVKGFARPAGPDSWKLILTCCVVQETDDADSI